MFKMFYAENRNQLFKGEMRDETTDDEVREIRTDETGSAGYGGTGHMEPQTDDAGGHEQKSGAAPNVVPKRHGRRRFFICVLKGKKARSPGMSGIRTLNAVHLLRMTCSLLS